MSAIAQMGVESGVLRVRLQGSYSLAQAERNFVDVLQEMARRVVAKVLFDGREVGGDPRFMERFEYGEFTARAYVKALGRGAVSGAARFAYVLTPPVYDPETISQVVAQNRGMRFRVFDELGKAQAWLEESVGPSPREG